MFFVETLNHILWDGPLLVLLLGTHIYFTIKLKFPQLNTIKGILLSISSDPYTSKESSNLSGFATLATTLAATLGTGNIIGVSTAIALGGPGAMFWCWLTGILGMATSYGECYLSVLFKHKKKDGIYVGGPMYVLEKGLHSRFLGKIYALCTLLAALGIGCTVQSNSIKEAIHSLYPIPPFLIGIVVSLFTALIILGGIQSIGKFCTKMVPFLGLLYIFCCIILIYLNKETFFPAIELILHSAFQPQSVTAGFIGSTFQNAMRFGIARGLFTNEAGIGTASIAAGACESQNPKRQSLISMTAVFWDTVIMCALTGIVIVSTILKYPNTVNQVNPGGLTTLAFSYLPFAGTTILAISLIAFAITTLIGWSYFGETATIYLFGQKGLFSYHILYLIMVFLGTMIPLHVVWNCTDLINGIMVFPNLIALWGLRKRIQI